MDLSTQAEHLIKLKLLEQDWRILALNYRHIGTELDIIARKGETLLAVEVKARRKRPTTMVDFQNLIPFRKRQSLLRGLQWFQRTHPLHFRETRTARIDLAVVVFEKKTVSGSPQILWHVNI